MCSPLGEVGGVHAASNPPEKISLACFKESPVALADESLILPQVVPYENIVPKQEEREFYMYF